MLIAYLPKRDLKPELITEQNKDLLHDALWIDMLLPTRVEELLVENLLEIDIPTREEMQGIEPSTRLYKGDNTLVMTATMIAKSNSSEPHTDAITLIIKDNKLLTLRYIEPLAFDLFVANLPKLPVESYTAIHLAVTLLELTIDRLADISEQIGRHLDAYSLTVFRKQALGKHKLDYKHLLQDLGANGDLNAKAWESLSSFNRLNSFFGQAVASQLDEDAHFRLTMLTNDITAISDQVKFLTSKVNFLLDATLGLVNIEQNNIIKIFSIAAVIFLPPTLIASIYGMNFHLMPGLSWRYGYLFSLGLMLLSGWLPYQYFKIKKWL